MPTTADVYQTTVVSQQRMHSVPTRCWPSEAFWQVYIARQSSQGLIEGQAIQRSLLQQEDTLKQWIISMNKREAAPRPSSVQVMANILISERGELSAGIRLVQPFALAGRH
jgi:hypothetical protein